MYEEATLTEMTPDATAEVLVLGRSGVDIYPLQTGVGLEDVSTFGKYLGGSAANVSVAAARLGRRSALLSGVGDDPFGRYVRRELRRLGVDDRYLVLDPDHPTPVTFCEIFPPDHFPIYFYRRPTAPDLQIQPADLDTAAVRAASVLWMTVTGLSEEPSRSTHLECLRIRGRREHTVLDLDFRPMFWPSASAATQVVRPLLAQVTVAVGNLEECAVAVGETDPDRAADPHRAADALLAAGVDLAVVKQGPRGVLIATADDRVEVPPVPVEVVNGLGAGDGFGGALCHGLMSGWGLPRLAGFANAAGAIVASRLECSTAMPTLEEVVALMATTQERTS